MKKHVALVALAALVAVSANVSFAGTSPSSSSSSSSASRPSPPPPPPPARTVSTSFGSAGSAPKSVSPPPSAPKAEVPAPKPAPVAAAPKPQPAVPAPAPTPKVATGFGEFGKAPQAKPAETSVPARSASALSADLTKSAQQKAALETWDNRNRAAAVPPPTELRRDHVAAYDTAPRRIEQPSRSASALAAERERERLAERERQVAQRERQVVRDERRQDYYRDRPVQQSSNNDFATGVIVGSALSHNNDRPVVIQQAPAPTVQSVPAASAPAEQPLQRYEASGSGKNESSGSAFGWFLAILLTVSLAAAVVWFMNRKPTVPVVAASKPSRHNHYGLGDK